jgi:hypothetical protein
MSRIIAVLIYLLRRCFVLSPERPGPGEPDVQLQCWKRPYGAAESDWQTLRGKWRRRHWNAPTSINIIRLKVISGGVAFRLASLLFIRSKAPRGVNLYTVTGNYRFRIDSLAGSAFGVYVIGGGG